MNMSMPMPMPGGGVPLPKVSLPKVSLPSPGSVLTGVAKVGSGALTIVTDMVQQTEAQREAANQFTQEHGYAPGEVHPHLRDQQTRPQPTTVASPPTQAQPSTTRPAPPSLGAALGTSLPSVTAPSAQQLRQQFNATQLNQTATTLNMALQAGQAWASHFTLAGLKATVVPFAQPQQGQYPHELTQQAYQSALNQAKQANQAAQQSGSPLRTIAFQHRGDDGLPVAMLVKGNPSQLAQWQSSNGGNRLPVLTQADFTASGVTPSGLASAVTGNGSLPQPQGGGELREFSGAANRPSDVAFMQSQMAGDNLRNPAQPKVLLQLPSGSAFTVEGLNPGQLVNYLQQVAHSGAMTQQQLTQALQQNGLGDLTGQVFGIVIKPEEEMLKPDPTLDPNNLNNNKKHTVTLANHTGQTASADDTSTALGGFDTQGVKAPLHTGETNGGEDLSVLAMPISDEDLEAGRLFREQNGLSDRGEPKHDALHVYLGLGVTPIEEAQILGIEDRARGIPNSSDWYAEPTRREAYESGYNTPQEEIDELLNRDLIEW